jgi:hypothetical protein
VSFIPLPLLLLLLVVLLLADVPGVLQVDAALAPFYIRLQLLEQLGLFTMPDGEGYSSTQNP